MTASKSPTPADVVEVIQSDRDAAAALLCHGELADWQTPFDDIDLATGRFDRCALVQAFARYRISLSSAPVGREALIEKIRAWVYSPDRASDREDFEELADSILSSAPAAADVVETVPCGGGGAKKDSERCMGCFHDFGTPESAWVRQYNTAALKPGATS